MRKPTCVADSERARPYPAERLVSYTDAIFSIAVTLLVIDIKLSESDEAVILARSFTGSGFITRSAPVCTLWPRRSGCPRFLGA